MDGRYAVTSEEIVAIGGRQVLARWCEQRAERGGAEDPAERAWLQEIAGALLVPAAPRRHR